MSIAARCPLTGMLGVAVASSSIAVASRCANVRAGVGAALSQNVTDPSLGRRALDLMESGKSAQDVIELFLRDHPFMAWRQLVLVPSVGAPAVFSGDRTLGVFWRDQCLARMRRSGKSFGKSIGARCDDTSF